jgi:hypothetical protein
MQFAVTGGTILISLMLIELRQRPHRYWVYTCHTYIPPGGGRLDPAPQHLRLHLWLWLLFWLWLQFPRSLLALLRPSVEPRDLLRLRLRVVPAAGKLHDIMPSDLSHCASAD